MKERLGFVSNSSSSSFAIFGWKFKASVGFANMLADYFGVKKCFKDKEEAMEFLYDLPETKEGIVLTNSEDDWYFGVGIEAFGDGAVSETPLKKLVAAADELAKEANIKEEPKLIAGTIYN